MIVHRLDRREQLKARHRSAIVAAAHALIAERGTTAFSTEELAERADVSRRTVFNHFASLEDVVVACVESELTAVISSLEDVVEVSAADVSASGEESPHRTALDDLETSLRQADLVGAISRISRLLSTPTHEATAERVQHEAMHRTASAMVLFLSQRHPHEQVLRLELLAGSTMSGVGVLAKNWVQRSQGSIDPGNRRLWDELLDDLLAVLRRGFDEPTSMATTTTRTKED